MSSIIDLIFFSEKRKQLLIYLSDGPKDIENIKSTLGVKAVALMPQIKKLKEMDLIYQNRDTYELSDIGKAIVEKMMPLTDLLAAFEGNKDYWSKHDRTCIPDHMIRKLHMLGRCTLIEPSLDHLFEFPEELKEKILHTRTLKSFYSFFCPDCPTIQATCAKNGTEVQLVLDKKIYERLKRDFYEEYKTLLENNVSMYVYSGEKKPSSVIVTDEFMMLKLFGKEGKFDHSKILSFNKSALEWGEELFEYYMKRSEKVNEQ